MKRLASSAPPLMSICQPTSDERSPRNDQNHIYNRELHTMLEGFDEEGCEELGSHINEKKRRLRVDQVKALEKNFEVENKLEPERKVRLAQELGLQPRQVAVWFQNRRARWKTKQLERDYNALKANYDALKVNYDSLQRDNDALREDINGLRAKLNGEKAESIVSVKEEITTEKFDNELLSDDQEEEVPLLLDTIATSTDPNYRSFSSEEVAVMSMFSDVKDGSSDSDSSAILNEEINNTSPNHAISSSGLIQNNQYNIHSTNSSSYYVKLEEHDFISSHEEACDFFSDEQAPSLQWYCHDQWN